MPHLVAGLRRVENVRMGINYGLNKVRFPAPVPVGSRVRARMTLVEVERLGEDAVQTTGRVTIEIEGGSKPACVADMVSRLYFAPASGQASGGRLVLPLLAGPAALLLGTRAQRGEELLVVVGVGRTRDAAARPGVRARQVRPATSQAMEPMSASSTTSSSHTSLGRLRT